MPSTAMASSSSPTPTSATAPSSAPISAFLIDIRDHERAHVETLTQVITDLGGEPVEEAEYNFGYTDAASFLTVAQALENTGV